MPRDGTGILRCDFTFFVHHNLDNLRCHHGRHLFPCSQWVTRGSSWATVISRCPNRVSKSTMREMLPRWSLCLTKLLLKLAHAIHSKNKKLSSAGRTQHCSSSGRRATYRIVQKHRRKDVCRHQAARVDSRSFLVQEGILDRHWCRSAGGNRPWRRARSWLGKCSQRRFSVADAYKVIASRNTAGRLLTSAAAPNPLNPNPATPPLPLFLQLLTVFQTGHPWPLRCA